VFFFICTTRKKDLTKKRDLRVMALLDIETKKKLDFICERDKRAMSNMMAFLIDNYYRQVKGNEGGIVYKTMTKEQKEDFKKMYCFFTPR
jgi:hypothetical protein